MYRIRKKFQFEAAHVLPSAYSEDCHKNIHGHSYTVEVFLKSTGLNQDGMVLDFGFLKQWINEVKDQWNHALFLPSGRMKLGEGIRNQLPDQKILYMHQPTAEYMASALFCSLNVWLDRQTIITPCLVDRVRVHETATGWAEYSES